MGPLGHERVHFFCLKLPVFWLLSWIPGLASPLGERWAVTFRVLEVSCVLERSPGFLQSGPVFFPPSLPVLSGGHHEPPVSTFPSGSRSPERQTCPWTTTA